MIIKKKFKSLYNKKLSFILLFLTLSAIMKTISNSNNELEKKLHAITKEKMNEYSKNCFGSVIIGGGIAGIAAAIYTARMGLPTGLFIGTTDQGGQLVTTDIVENYPGVEATGPQIIETGIKQVIKTNASVIEEKVLKIEVNNIDKNDIPYKITTNKGVYYSFTVILAMGSTVKKLGCKGESTFWGKGVSSCTTCDAPLYKNKVVIVVGGGDSACTSAIHLTAHASKIYMLVRSDKMRASQVMQDRVKKNKEKITILYNTEIKEIIGEEGSIKDVILVDKNENDPINFNFSEKFNQKISGIFITIGHSPNTDLVKDFVELDEHGLVFLPNGGSQLTSKQGVYVAGDLCNTFRQAIIAGGEGAKAAMEACNYLLENNIDQNFFEYYKNVFFDTTLQNKQRLEEKEKEKESTSSKTEGKEEIGGCDGNSCPISIQKTTSNKVKSIKKQQDYRNLATEHSDSYYIIFISGNSCPACTQMKRKTLKTYSENKNALPVYEVNYEDEKILSTILKEKFELRSLPSYLVMKGKKIISKKLGTGFKEINEFKKWIDSNTKK